MGIIKLKNNKIPVFLFLVGLVFLGFTFYSILISEHNNYGCMGLFPAEDCDPSCNGFPHTSMCWKPNEGSKESPFPLTMFSRENNFQFYFSGFACSILLSICLIKEVEDEEDTQEIEENSNQVQDIHN